MNLIQHNIYNITCDDMIGYHQPKILYDLVLPRMREWTKYPLNTERHK